MSKIRFGVIGTGDMGQVHMKNIHKSDSADLVAVHDLDANRLQSIAEKYKVPAYTEIQDFLCDKNLDAVIIATPHPSHSQIAIDVLNSGKDVFVEKPMAVTVREAEDMIASARKKGLSLAVDYQHRARLGNSRAHEMISSGELGVVMHVSLTYAVIRTQYYYNSASWRGTWKREAGGVMINQSAHHLDILQWLVGMPAEIYAWTETTRHSDIEVEDTVTAILRYPNGAHGEIHLSTGELPVERFEITCEKGKIILENYDWASSGPVAEKGNSKLTVIKSDIQEFIKTNKSMYEVPPQERTEHVLPYNDEDRWPIIVEDFVDSLITGNTPMIPGEEGIKSLELVNAITLSSKKQKLVKLPIDRAEYDCLLDDLKAGRYKD